MDEHVQVGQRIGMLIVLEKLAERDIHGRVLWECLCDCNNLVVYTTRQLTKETGLRSCGCSRYKRNQKPNLLHVPGLQTKLWELFNALNRGSKTEINCCLKELYRCISNFVNKDDGKLKQS